MIPALREKFSRIYYVGREGGREKFFAESAGVPFFGVPAVKFERDKPLSLLTTPPRLLDCARKAERVLRELMPDVIFCKGGYVSLPCALAARRLHIPVVNHESDLSLGLANKLISRFSCATITSFPETKAKRAVFLGKRYSLPLPLRSRSTKAAPPYSLSAALRAHARSMRRSLPTWTHSPPVLTSFTSRVKRPIARERTISPANIRETSPPIMPPPTQWSPVAARTPPANCSP